MVRAAATGAIDYSRADPTSRHWRIHQHLILTEIQRQEDEKLLTTVHKHWLAYIAHGGLKEESFADVKTHANELLRGIRRNIFPWSPAAKSEDKNDTIKDETKDLAERYKAFKARLDAENQRKNSGG